MLGQKLNVITKGVPRRCDNDRMDAFEAEVQRLARTFAALEERSDQHFWRFTDRAYSAMLALIYCARCVTAVPFSP